MEPAIFWAKWILSVATIMASPIVAILVVPPVVGIAFEVADLSSERMLVLLLWAPAGLALLRRLASQVPARLPVAA